ncbi:MAG: AMP-binding protein [Deltaproteobacteria bacterium]|nr:AMP-binding protein [Deltaproteobacteria bacterium]MBW2344950.1 AMP-binding protein [Deltaproteobacteria bacterium]
MKPVRYDQEEILRYLKEGYWDKTILPDYWDRNARQWPDKEALVDSLGSRLTWKEATEKIDRIALALVKEVGLQRDDRLMVQLPNCVEQVLVRLACQKAGVIAIPEMTTFRQTELLDIATRTEAVGIVIPREYRKFDHYEMAKDLQSDLPNLKHVIVAGEDVPQGCISLQEIMDHAYEEEYDPIELIARKVDAVEEVGFLVTTTGTTGLPKLIEHRIAARDIWTAKAHVRNWQLGPDDCVLAIAPLAGAAGGTPAYVTAPVGGAKIALEYQYRGEETLAFMEKERVTLIALVPTQLARLLELPVDKYDLSSLRIIKTAGGYLPPPLAKKGEASFGCPILGTYGTQDTGSISGVPITATDEQRYTTVGRLHLGIEIKILDDSGKQVDKGGVGTLWFKGPGNSIGYYKDLEKTMNEAFDEEGFATPGDLVTLGDDGFLKIMGRKKNIIIRGGQNIYPREIEDYLLTNSKVTNVAVVPMPDPTMGERACAFVTLKEGEEFTFDEMIDFLKTKKIAPFKLPERLEVLEALPLVGESGKIDNKAMVKMITEKLKEEGKIK